jgi:hypothetical protein
MTEYLIVVKDMTRMGKLNQPSLRAHVIGQRFLVVNPRPTLSSTSTSTVIENNKLSCLIKAFKRGKTKKTLSDD